MKIDDRFRTLKDVDAPDLWEDVVHRRPRPDPGPGRGSRYVAAAVALVVAAAGFAVVVRAFMGSEAPQRPGREAPAPVDPQVDRTIPTEGWANAAVAAFGGVWVTEAADDGGFGGSLLRLDPATGDVVARVPVDTIPQWEWSGEGLTVGDGSLWIANAAETSEAGSGAAVVRVDPVANRQVEVIDLNGDFAADVEVGLGAIWVSVFTGEGNELLRVDPDSHEVVARIPLESSYSRNVLIAGGSVWVQEYMVQGSTVGGTVVARVDPATNQATGRLNLGGPAKLAVFDGELWALIDDGFVRIDPETGTAGSEPVRVGEDPTSGGIGEQVSSASGANVAPGAGGLWFIQKEHGDLTLSRFVPRTGEVDASVVLPPKATPIAMTVTDESIWVVDYDRSLIRIALGP